MTKPKHGGARKGAGRPKSTEAVKYTVSVDKVVITHLKAKYGKELPSKVRLALHKL